MKRTATRSTPKLTPSHAVATLADLTERFAMVSLDEIAMLSSLVSVKVLALRRVWPFSKFRTRDLTVYDVVSVLGCSRASAYRGLVETAVSPVRLPSHQRDESSHQRDNRVEVSVSPVRQTAPQERDEPGESARVEGASDVSSIEKKQEKTKSALLLPLPSFFPRL